MNEPQSRVKSLFKRSDLYDGLTFYFLPRKRMVFLCTLLYDAFKFESAAVSSSFTVCVSAAGVFFFVQLRSI